VTVAGNPLAHIDPAALRAALRAHYGLQAGAITPLAGGLDPHARVFRADADEAAHGGPWLVRVMRAWYETGLQVPRLLQAAGVEQVVPPLSARDGALHVPLDAAGANGLHVAVFPFITGRSGAAGGLSAAQWRQFGATLRQVHHAPLPDALRRALPTWEQPGQIGRWLQRALPVWRRQSGRTAAARELARHIDARHDELQAIVARLLHLHGRLAARIAAGELPCTLCHADAHVHNVMVDEQGRMWLIDWDGASWSPIERDLVFVIGGISADLVRPHETAWFLEGYGPEAVDWPTLATYRYAWAVTDMHAYGAEALTERDEATAAAAAAGFRRLFAPGAIVELARAGEVWL
jgi:spectinomycin phosphotransferase